MGNEGVLCGKRELALLAFLVLVGLGIRLYFLQFYDVISADGISYVSLAKDFITGRGLAGATHYPPFYPILLGLFSTVSRDFETAGLTVSVLMGSLLVVPVYLLGIEFFDRKVALSAAVLSTTWPTLRYWSTAVMSQATYITLLLLGVYCLWRAYRNCALLPAIFAGVFFAGAHLTRSEGVLVLFAQVAVLVAVTFLRRLERRKLLYVSISLAVFFVLFSPYLVMLHDLTGKWQLTGKSRIAIADALSIFYHRPDIKFDPRFEEIGYLDLFRSYPDYIRTNYLKNLRQCWQTMLPWYGWALAGLGILFGIRQREKLAERAFLLSTFAPLPVIIVFFFVGPEYTQPYLPVLFLFIGNCLSKGASSLASLGQKGAFGTGRIAGCITCLPVALAVLYGAWNVVSEVPADRNVPYSYERDGGRYDQKRIGLKLSRLLPKNAVIMTRSGRIGFYSARRAVMPPQTDFAGIVQCAKKEKADYLIATPELIAMRPQLEFLLAPITDPDRPFTPPPALDLWAVDQLPGGIPYIVYRFK